jgi:hypothetical protein
MARSYVHGTYTAYARHGCRCDLCRAYQNERVRRNRADRLAAGRLTHGRRSTWDAAVGAPSAERCIRQRTPTTDDAREQPDPPPGERTSPSSPGGSHNYRASSALPTTSG